VDLFTIRNGSPGNGFGPRGHKGDAIHIKMDRMKKFMKVTTPSVSMGRAVTAYASHPGGPTLFKKSPFSSDPTLLYGGDL
jgi:hypothetical protein